MTTALRVFISSTMKDLVNERDAVCRKLKEFNFTPVNAEGWLPDGTTSWERIAAELQGSDLFVLLLGESYGWIPTKGPKAGDDLAVSEIEYREARAQAIPVLPFLQNLPYGADSVSEEAKRRDAFRKQVMEWEEGYFVGRFDLASDLANSVAKALVDVLTREFQRSRVRERVQTKSKPGKVLEFGEYVPPSAPESLLHDVLNGDAMLFAGAGMSLAAGLPSAAAFAQYLSDTIREIDPGYVGGTTFAGVAADLEAITSRQTLVDKVRSLLTPPQGLTETSAHSSAVRFFELIFTTNWDDLFEQALQTALDTRPVLTEELSDALPERALVKLHGTLLRPQTLLMTEGDIASMEIARHRLWSATRQALRTRPVIVVGTQLRDPSIVKLFHESRPLKGGYFVAPTIDATTQARLKSFNLTGVAITAEAMFERLRWSADT
ncbi:MAG: DUF4062 domain-containing protein [Acidobacteriota bacterium]